ncbi:MAG: hypothetical protein ABI467_17775, partial [Kofleriaceae bacterium]
MPRPITCTSITSTWPNQGCAVSDRRLAPVRTDRVLVVFGFGGPYRSWMATAKTKTKTKAPHAAPKATPIKATPTKAKATKAKATKPAAVKPAAAKAPSKPNLAKRSPVSIEQLLERARVATAGVNHIDPAVCGIEDAARACVDAGRADLAAAFAAALPEGIRGTVAMLAARGGDGSIEAAIDLLIAEAANGHPHDRPVRAGVALEASHALGARSVKRAEVVGFVDSVIDERLQDGTFKPLLPLLMAQQQTGETRTVERILDRWMQEDASTLDDALETLAWVKADDVEYTLTLLNALDESDRSRSLEHHDGLRACAAWPLPELEKLVALVPVVRTELGKQLLAVARTDDARHIFFHDFIDPYHWNRVERHQLLGETDAVTALLDEPWTDYQTERQHLRIELGMQTFAKAREDERHPIAPTGGSVMHAVGQLQRLVELALTHEARAEIPPIMEAIERLLASKQRTHYDQGVEGSTRSQLGDLRLRLLGDDARAIDERLEADLGDLPALRAFGRDAYGKDSLVASFVRRAIRYRRPDLALKAAKLLGTHEKTQISRAVAQAFVSTDPGRALDALATLAGPAAATVLVSRPPRIGRTINPSLIA